MARTVVAVFDGEVFRPTEPLELPAGTEYRLTIASEEEGSERSTDQRPLMKYLDLVEELDLPSDFAAQHDHYLYGTPKR